MMNYYNKTDDEIFKESKQQAEEDLKNGILGLRIFGHIDNTDLIKQAYKEKNIKIEIIAGDCISSDIKANADGYAEVMMPEIEKRFGKNVLEEIFQRYCELLAAQINYMNYCTKTNDESKQQAEEDLKNGILGLKTFGLIRSPDLLKQAYK